MSINCGNSKTLGVHSHESVDEVKACFGQKQTSKNETIDLGQFKGVVVTPTKRTKAFTDGRYDMEVVSVVGEVNSNTGNPQVKITLKFVDQKVRTHVINEWVVLFNGGLTVISDFNCRLNGNLIESDVTDPYVDFLETLPGMQISCWVRRNKGSSILGTSMTTWRKVS